VLGVRNLEFGVTNTNQELKKDKPQRILPIAIAVKVTSKFMEIRGFANSACLKLIAPAFRGCVKIVLIK
jgi:hypothetical protein